MSRILVVFFFGSLVLLASVRQASYFTLLYADYAVRSVHHHEPSGGCQPLAGIERGLGAEDFTLLNERWLFVTSGLNWNDKQSSEFYRNKRGRIFAFDTNATDEIAIELTLPRTNQFQPDLLNPQGIDSFDDELYVINHRRGSRRDLVEVFRFDQSSMSLHHVRSLTDQEHFIGLNTLAVVGRDRFYFSRDRFFRSPAIAKLELFLYLPSGSVGLFDSSSANILQRFLVLPNGVALSRDARFLFVSSTSDRTIDTYFVDNGTAFQHRHRYHVGVLPDNLHVDAGSGALWVGAHGNLAEIWKYVAEADPIANGQSSSVVLRLQIDERDGRVKASESMYADNGERLSGASTAVRLVRDRFLIGSIHDVALLCRL